MATVALEPFGFFTADSLRAGWYLTWRIFVRIVPLGIVAGVLAVGAAAVLGPLGIVLAAAVGLSAVAWSLRLVPQLTSQWAQERYGRALERWLEVWWGISWRTFVVSLVAAVIMAVPNVVAVSLQTAYADSTLGMLGGLVIGLLTIANFVVSIMAQGWAMSRVTSAQLGGAEPLAPTWSPSAEAGMAGDAEPGFAAVSAEGAAAPAPRSVARTATAADDGQRQCPKCGLQETERGTVIGWYCRVCGWREGRR